ncbi:MAG: hypothetical protein COA80_00030 [Leeuwenhoekiella sp.]|nr:MAG: hypothetical protein COA80_00030 [Leeuwenhoekiella sp.]
MLQAPDEVTVLLKVILMNMGQLYVRFYREVLLDLSLLIISFQKQRPMVFDKQRYDFVSFTKMLV